MKDPRISEKSRHTSGLSTNSTDSVSNYIPTPPDGGYGWVIVMAAFFIHVIVDGVVFAFGVFYVVFLEYFDEGKGKTSLVGSLLSGFYLLMCFVASALVNKFGCRPVSIAGSLISAVAFFLSIFSPSLNVLMLTYGVLGGSGFALMFFPSVIAVSCYFQRRRALATGIAVCGAGAGGFIMAPFVRYLLDIYDWKNAMLIISGICLNGCIFASLLRPLPTPRKKSVPRTKNVIDRLKEITRRTRMESECSICERANANRMSMKQRIREVKLAREQRLKEEDSDSDFDSLVSHALKCMNAPSGNMSICTASSTSNTNAPICSWPSPNVLETNIVWSAGAATRIRSTSEPPLACFQRGTSLGEVSFCFPPVIPEEMEETFQSSSTLNINESEGDGSSIDSQSMPHISAIVGGHNTQGDIDISPTSDDAMKATIANGVSVEDVNMRDIKVTWKSLPKLPGIRKVDFTRPLYRKDVFYSGSSFNLGSPSTLDARTYAKSMLSIPGDVSPQKESCLCRMIPKAAKDTLREMMDFSLFKETCFVVIVIGNLLAYTGLYVPYVFMSDRAVMLGIPHNDAAMLLSVIGFMNMLGRLLSGVLADRKCTNVLLLHNASLLAAGAACVLNMFSSTYPLMCLFAAVFGLCVAYVSLTSIVLCDMLGIERLTNAYGLLCTFRGLAAITGPPLAGAVLDVTGDMDIAFHVGGILIILSGLVFSLLHLSPFSGRRPGKSHIDATGLGKSHSDATGPGKSHSDATGPGKSHSDATGPWKAHSDATGPGKSHCDATAPGNIATF